MITYEAIYDIFDEIVDKRRRQVVKGYTPEHDDAHSVADLVGYALQRLKYNLARDQLLEAAAVLIAAIESIDRREERGQ